MDPELDMDCGRLVANEDREDNGLVAIVKPGFSEMIMFEKKVKKFKLAFSNLFLAYKDDVSMF